MRSPCASSSSVTHTSPVHGRIRRRGHLLRGLGLPDLHALAARGDEHRTRPHRCVLCATCAPDPAGRGARARSSPRCSPPSSCRCRESRRSSVTRAGRRSSLRQLCTSRRSARTTSSRTAPPHRCSTPGRWPWRSSSTWSGRWRCCSSSGCSPARQLLVTRIVVVAAWSASLVWSVFLTESSPVAAYFSSATRAWELATGALLALAGHQLSAAACLGASRARGARARGHRRRRRVVRRVDGLSGLACSPPRRGRCSTARGRGCGDRRRCAGADPEARALRRRHLLLALPLALAGADHGRLPDRASARTCGRPRR